MNLFDLPWSTKAPPPEPEGEKKKQFLGVRNEVVRDDAGSAEAISIEVRGLKEAASGQYRLAYTEGQPLSRYLHRIKLKRAAAYSAVYDLTNPSHGRCRSSYIPQSGARILIGPPDVSPQLRYQRASTDATQVMARMKTTEVSLEPKKPSNIPTGRPPQWNFEPMTSLTSVLWKPQ